MSPIAANSIVAHEYRPMLCWQEPQVFCWSVLLRCFSKQCRQSGWPCCSASLHLCGMKLNLFYRMSRKGKCGTYAEIFGGECTKWQVAAPVDYLHRDPVAVFFSGSLNYETVHRLLSAVSKYHYLPITSFVVKIAQKSGPRLLVDGSYTSLRWCLGHVTHFRSIGQKRRTAAEARI